jgi:hypothetical protein
MRSLVRFQLAPRIGMGPWSRSGRRPTSELPLDRMLGHAGVGIAHAGTGIVVDPWFATPT